MNGPHDLGGMMGFGPVVQEPCEAAFHDNWQARAFALTLAMGATGKWNIDTSRHARERIPPGRYLTSSYYEIWFEALVTLLNETGATGQPPAPLAASDVARVLARGSPANRPPRRPARFSTGDRVTTRNMNPTGHTRLARYLRARSGEIIKVHGVHVFPDDNASGRGENPQWLYTVRFSARELWGEDHPETDFVHADLWEPYFE